MDFFFKRLTAFCTLFSYVLMMLTSSGVLVAKPSIELSFYYKEDFESGNRLSSAALKPPLSLTKTPPLWMQFKTSDGELREEKLTLDPKKVTLQKGSAPSKEKTFDSEEYHLRLQSFAKKTVPHQLNLKGPGCNVVMTLDEKGHLKLHNIQSTIPLTLLAPGSVNLDAREHEATSLFLGAPYIYNRGTLEIKDYLGLCGGDQGEAETLLNLPSGRLQCTGKMDVFQGTFKNHGLFVAERDLTLDLHGTSFLHHHTEGPINLLSVAGRLRVVNGDLVDIRGPVHAPDFLPHSDLEIQAQTLQSTHFIQADHLKLKAQNLFLSPESETKGQVIQIKADQGKVAGDIQGSKSLTYQGQDTQFYKSSTIQAPEIQLASDTLKLQGLMSGHDLYIAAQENLDNNGVVNAEQNLTFWSFGGTFNRGNLNAPELNFFADIFKNTGLVEGNNLLLESVTSFLNKGTFKLQEGGLFRSRGRFKNEGLIESPEGDLNFSFAHDGVNTGDISAQTGEMTFKDGGLINEAEGTIHLSESLLIQGQGKIWNKGTIITPDFSLLEEVKTLNSGLLDVEKTYFKSPNSAFHNKKGIFRSKRTTGTIGSFYNTGTGTMGICDLSIKEGANTSSLTATGQMTITNFENMGTFEGLDLILKIIEKGENKGNLSLKTLEGQGYFDK